MSNSYFTPTLFSDIDFERLSLAGPNRNQGREKKYPEEAEHIRAWCFLAPIRSGGMMRSPKISHISKSVPPRSRSNFSSVRPFTAPSAPCRPGEAGWLSYSFTVASSFETASTKLAFYFNKAFRFSEFSMSSRDSLIPTIVIWRSLFLHLF